MNKAEAIDWYKQVTGGSGVDRTSPLDVIDRGSLAKRQWDDGLFTLGVEYGVLIALVRAFDLTKADIGGDIELYRMPAD
jgi:hypothetical protein